MKKTTTDALDAKAAKITKIFKIRSIGWLYGTRVWGSNYNLPYDRYFFSFKSEEDLVRARFVVKSFGIDLSDVVFSTKNLNEVAL